MAGRYLLRQGLFYPGLFFIGTDNPAKESFTNCIKPVGSTIFPLMNFRISVKSTSKKTGRTKQSGLQGKQATFSKTRKIFNLKLAQYYLISNSY
jgi:hypothetical protein